MSVTRFRLDCECEVEAALEPAALGIVIASHGRLAQPCRVHAAGRTYAPDEVPASRGGGSAEARGVIERHIADLEREVLSTLATHPAGLGAVELAEKRGWPADRARPRLTTMARRAVPLCRDTGRMVPTPRGAHEIVWQITDAGRALLSGH